MRHEPAVNGDRKETGDERWALCGDRRTRDSIWTGVPLGAEPRRLPVPGRLHLPGQDRGGLRAPAVLLPAVRRALVAAGGRAQVRWPAQGRPRRDAAIQLSRDAGGAFWRSRGRGDPGRGQQPAVQRRDRLHPRSQRRALPAGRQRIGTADRAAGAGRRDGDPLHGHRRPGRLLRAVPGQRAAVAAAELAGTRGRDDLDQLHLRHHGPAQGGPVHLPGRVPERAGRGDPRRPGRRFGVPVDAADVPLQRLVLPVGGHRGRRPPCDPALGGPGSRSGS